MGVQLRCCLLFFYSQVCSFRPVACPGTLMETIVDTTVEAVVETIRSAPPCRVTGQERPTSTSTGQSSGLGALNRAGLGLGGNRAGLGGPECFISDCPGPLPPAPPCDSWWCG